VVRLLEDYRQYVDPQAKLALFVGWTGLDLSGVDLAGPVAGQSFREAVLGAGDRLADDHYGARFRQDRSF